VYEDIVFPNNVIIAEQGLFEDTLIDDEYMVIFEESIIPSKVYS